VSCSSAGQSRRLVRSGVSPLPGLSGAGRLAVMSWISRRNDPSLTHRAIHDRACPAVAPDVAAATSRSATQVRPAARWAAAAVSASTRPARGRHPYIQAGYAPVASRTGSAARRAARWTMRSSAVGMARGRVLPQDGMARARAGPGVQVRSRSRAASAVILVSRLCRYCAQVIPSAPGLPLCRMSWRAARFSRTGSLTSGISECGAGLAGRVTMAGRFRRPAGSGLRRGLCWR
jgi:hypothetical protein